ncbi:MAG TPA: hypothetical protein PLV68_19180, partial [Ilumatobacteraceae bacterium]|nr:hypothetical protein [Ilumatobacteraceae bacterium]
MTQPSVCPAQFDHHAPDFAQDPWGVLAELRTSCPVAHSEMYDGFWVLTAYADIKEVATDDVRFSSAQGLTVPDKKNRGQRSIPAEVDPPEFLAYRRILHPMLSPTAVDRLTPVIERFVHAAIDNVIEAGRCDFVHDLADPVPAMTTLYKLGLPLDRWKEFSEPLHQVVFMRQDNPARSGAIGQLKVISDTLYETIAARRESPRDDMISYLLHSDIDGRPLKEIVRERGRLMKEAGDASPG